MKLADLGRHSVSLSSILLQNSLKKYYSSLLTYKTFENAFAEGPSDQRCGENNDPDDDGRLFLCFHA